MVYDKLIPEMLNCCALVASVVSSRSARGCVCVLLIYVAKGFNVGMEIEKISDWM